MEQINNITSSYKKFLDTVQTEVELDFSGFSNTVGKILCFNTSAKIDSTESLTGEALVTGTVYGNILYLDESGLLNNKTTSNTFTFRVMDENLNAMSLIIPKTEVVESSIISAINNEVRANVVLETSLTAILTEEITPYTTLDEQIKLNLNTQNFTMLAKSNKANFNLTQEQTLKLNTNNVFVTSANVCLKNITSGTGYFTIEGEVAVNYSAQSNDEDKPIKCWCETIDFKEEIEDEALLKDYQISAKAQVDLNSTNVEVTQQEGKITFVSTLPILVSYYALKQQDYQVVLDAYSVKCDCGLLFSNVKNMQEKEQMFLKDRIDGAFSINENEPRIAKISCVNPGNISLTKVHLNFNKLYIEGILNACIAYETDDSEIAISSVNAEVPFTSEFKIDDVNKNTQCSVCANILTGSAKAKKGKDIELEIEVCYSVSLFENIETPVLSNIELKDEYKKSEYALSVYIAPKGSTAWDVAKKLHTTPEIIQKQNPNVVFPLTDTTSIVYFKGKN